MNSKPHLVGKNGEMQKMEDFLAGCDFRDPQGVGPERNDRVGLNTTHRSRVAMQCSCRVSAVPDIPHLLHMDWNIPHPLSWTEVLEEVHMARIE